MNPGRKTQPACKNKNRERRSGREWNRWEKWGKLGFTTLLYHLNRFGSLDPTQDPNWSPQPEPNPFSFYSLAQPWSLFAPLVFYSFFIFILFACIFILFFLYFHSAFVFWIIICIFKLYHLFSLRTLECKLGLYVDNLFLVSFILLQTIECTNRIFL